MKEIVFVVLVAFGVQAGANGYLTSGVGFSAPEISGTANVPNPSNGDIILDATGPAFKGFNGVSWVELGGSAPATVAARYTTSAGQSIPSNTATIVDFGTADYDTTSSVHTGSSWYFEAPVSGMYSVKGIATFANASFTLGTGFALDLYLRGGFYQRIAFSRAVFTGSASYVASGTADIYLSAGDKIDLRVTHQESSARDLINSSGFNSISIHKFGD